METTLPKNPTAELLASILNTADEVLPRVLALLEGEDRQRRGGYFCFMSAEMEARAPTLLSLVGEVPIEKVEKYSCFVQEKPKRLYLHHHDYGHVSSWQSRDESLQRYGGAIRTNDGSYFSFSGLPELGDEALCLLVAMRLHRLEFDEAVAIAAHSTNNVFTRLIQK